MSRPKKKQSQYSIRENIVNDMMNNPEKYRQYEPKFDISKFRPSQEFIDLMSEFKNNKILQEGLNLLYSTGLSLNVTIPRIKGAKLNPLDLNLNREQLNTLLLYFNKRVLQDAIAIDDFEKMMKGEIYNSQYHVKKNRSLSVFFRELSKQGFITTKWQKELAGLKIFYSNRGKLLKAPDFSKALPEATENNNGIRKELIEIRQLMEEVKKQGE